MKKSLLALWGVLFFIVLSAWPCPLRAAENGGARISDSVEVLEQIMSLPEKGLPPQLLKNAYGIAVIPGVIKVGFIVGGRYGTGIVAVRHKDGSWSDPSFITLYGGSFGWQAGAQSTDIILVFKTARSIEGMMKGKFTLGADASIAAGPVGRSVSGATDAELKAEIYSYSRSRGLFAGLSLEGAALKIDGKENSTFYGRTGITAEDIFAGKVGSVPGPARRLKGVLTKYAPAPQG